MQLWIDLRATADDMRTPIAEAAVHLGTTALVDDRLNVLATLPPSVLMVLAIDGGTVDGDAATDGVSEFVRDWVVVPHDGTQDVGRLAGSHPGSRGVIPFVVVADRASPDLACDDAKNQEITFVRFLDPTKIPLEIVIAVGPTSRRAAW